MKKKQKLNIEQKSSYENMVKNKYISHLLLFTNAQVLEEQDECPHHRPVMMAAAYMFCIRSYSFRICGLKYMYKVHWLCCI